MVVALSLLLLVLVLVLVLVLGLGLSLSLRQELQQFGGDGAKVQNMCWRDG